jgi:WD40 repeat protein
VKLWDVGAKKALAMLSSPRDEQIMEIPSVALTPDAKMLAAGTYSIKDPSDKGNIPGLIKIWDVANKKERATLRGHVGSVAVGFTSNGKLLATAGADKTIRVWDTAGLIEKPK